MKSLFFVVGFVFSFSVRSQISFWSDTVVCQSDAIDYNKHVPDSLKGGIYYCPQSLVSLSSLGVFDTEKSGPGGFTIQYSKTLNNISYNSSSNIFVIQADSITPITDIIVTQCYGTYTKVDVTGRFSGITWNDTPFNSNPRYIGDTGTYTVQTTGQCPTSESFSIINNTRILRGYQNYYRFCSNKTIDTTINVAAPNTSYSYLWHDNNSTNPIRRLTSIGRYYLTITNDSCSILDSIDVIIDKKKLFQSNSLNECAEKTTLKTNQGFSSYLWDDNTTNDTLVADSSRTYLLTVTDSIGCEYTDTVFVSLIPPDSIHGVIKSKELCNSDSIVLYPFPIGHCSSCVWTSSVPGWKQRNGDSAVINTPGSYTLTSSGHCFTDTTIIIKTKDSLGLNNNITICLNKTVTIQTLENDNNQYIWSTGDTGSSVNFTILDSNKIWIKPLSGNLSECFNDTLTFTVLNCDSIFHIAGTVYWDKNQNGIQDPLEKGMPNVKVVSSNPLKVTHTDAKGNYSFTVYNSLATTLSATILPKEVFTQPNSGTISVNTIGQLPGNSLNNNFGVYHNPNFVDLTNYYYIPILRPGFSNYYTVAILNQSNRTAHNVLQSFAIDTLTTIDSVKITGATVNFFSTDSISLSIDSLVPYKKLFFYVYVSTPAGVENLGKKVCASSTISSDQEELNSANNERKVCTLIRGSYDPNHKEASIGDGPLEFGNKTLNYTIQFQNTGTDTAFNITVIDSLDLTYFKMETLKMLGSTHPYSLNIDSAGVAKWVFKDVLLVDSITNEPLSHGSFSFSIEYGLSITLDALNPDTLKNTAYIYFDYNPPIQTNVAFNYYSNNTNVAKLNKQELKLFPNPTTSTLTVQFQSNTSSTKSIKIKDTNGKTVIRSQQIVLLGKNEFQVDVEQLAKGLYFIQIGNEFMGKFVKQ